MEDEILQQFEERMEKKRETEEAQETQKAEALRIDYLKRTKRTDLRP